MKFGVVVFPGSNCDRDMQDALSQDLGYPVEMLWHKDSDLSHFTTEDCVVLPGGFSYGDYLRCGAIAKFSPMMQSVIEFANKGGKVLGVCNGFQILCEAGLLPGALLQNENQQFICKNVYIKTASSKALTIPIAHGEGRYFANKETLGHLEKTIKSFSDTVIKRVMLVVLQIQMALRMILQAFVMIKEMYLA